MPARMESQRHAAHSPVLAKRAIAKQVVTTPRILKSRVGTRRSRIILPTRAAASSTTHIGLTDNMAWQTAAYVRSLGRTRATPISGDARRGARLYESGGCASCHASSAAAEVSDTM